MLRLLSIILVSSAVVCASRTYSYPGTDTSVTATLTDTSNGLEGLCDTVKQSAGYLKIEGGVDKNYFYWYFESRSSPSTDPVVLWMTGGPGCSSSVALLFENGPCKPTADGSSTTLNPYSWNSNASLIYIDQPVGVGFSYGDASDEDHNEAMVAEDMFHFLHEFFAAHTELAGRELFIFGESYGGHFAPATAARVGKTLNLAGLAVGNGLTDPLVQYQYYPEMAFTYAKQKLGKPVISELAYLRMKAEWPKCQKMISECQSDTSACSGAQGFCNQAMIGPYEQTGLNPYDIRSPCKVPPLCYDMSAVDKFMTRSDVKTALGVNPDQKWSSCNFTVNAAFSDDWMKDFQMDVTPLLKNGTRVLIYAGDVDFICNWIGNKAWTMSLDWPGNAAFNAATDEPWFNSAGLARSAQNLTFLQVHDAGHMVPFDKPQPALQLLNDFLNNKF